MSSFSLKGVVCSRRAMGRLRKVGGNQPVSPWDSASGFFRCGWHRCDRFIVWSGCTAGSLYYWRMDVERIIDEIQQLEEMFEAPDIRPLSASDISAANRRHDEMHANSPWFRLWQNFGVCCRSENPVLRLSEGDS